MKMIGNKSCALDTNIIIDLFRGNEDTADKIDSFKKVFIPVNVLGELHLGAENSSRKDHHLKQIKALLVRSIVLHTSNKTASIYGNLKVHLKRKGKPIPENDIWIAALAIENKLSLVTRDKHFKNISELDILEL